jgi:hypothetical protein
LTLLNIPLGFNPRHLLTAEIYLGTPQEREIYVRLERRKRLQDTGSKKFTQEDKVHSTICRQKFRASQETAGP